MTLDREDLDDRQLRMLDVLTLGFEDEPLLDAASGAALYHRLRRDLTAIGATDADFEFLTGHLVRLVIESDNPFTPRQKTAQLMLISDIFALRHFQLLLEYGDLVAIDFTAPPITH